MNHHHHQEMNDEIGNFSLTRQQENERHQEACLSFCEGPRTRTSDRCINLSTNNNNVESIISRDLAELSIDERECIVAEIDGEIETVTREDLDFVKERLELLNQQLEAIVERASAYHVAMKQNPNYVSNKDFRLMFLRAEKFDSKKAAKRILQHFEYKKTLFGNTKLAEPITIHDLSLLDQDALQTGFTQLLGETDLAGRGILFMFPSLLKFTTWESMIRMHWYQLMVAMEDESVQRRGLVVVVFGSLPSTFQHFVRRLHYLSDGLPIRLVAVHACLVTCNNPVVRFFSQITKELRLRHRIHSEDTYVQCLYALHSFGINPKTVPIGDDGSPKLERHLQFIKMRKKLAQQEKQQGENDSEANVISSSDSVRSSPSSSHNTTSTSSMAIITPTDRDVLMGRGKKYRSHAGNIALDELVQSKFRKYQSASSRFEKTCVAMEIIQCVKESGGRFLVRDGQNSNWVLAPVPAALESVSFRCRCKNSTSTRSRRQSTKLASSCSNTTATINSTEEQAQSQSSHHQHRQHEVKESQVQDLQNEVRLQDHLHTELKRQQEELCHRLNLQRQLEQELEQSQLRWQQAHYHVQQAQYHHLQYEQQQQGQQHKP